MLVDQPGTKADTLNFLQGEIKSALVLPSFTFEVSDWENKPASIIKDILALQWQFPLVVRSSHLEEDGAHASHAGRFASCLDIDTAEKLKTAISMVIASYPDNSGTSQVLVQPMVDHVKLSGVAFSRDPNSGGNYYIINIDGSSGSTQSVTSGFTNDLDTVILHKNTALPKNPTHRKIVALLRECESIFGSNAIDIEFAIDVRGQIYLFQMRPLILAPDKQHASFEEESAALAAIAKKIDGFNRPHPYLAGKRTVFGIMPDWNPAEIIGIKPRPLALSLYKELVTDNIWAFQRDNYGYRNLRSFPLLIDFLGLPYIDVRVSFNSFIPKSLSESLAEKLIDLYLQRLIENPALHDKVEFEIIFSCLTFDFGLRSQLLLDADFTADEITQLKQALCELTNDVIHPEHGIWLNDKAKILKLQERFNQVSTAIDNIEDKLYWLLEDCKRYGTLPFAGLARAGFIAMQLLNSLVATGLLKPARKQALLASVSTVATEMHDALNELSEEDFLRKYGHLRPGTYDIRSPSYRESPEFYFQSEKNISEREKKNTFSWTSDENKKIDLALGENGLKLNAEQLLSFITEAIQQREFAKFEFSRHVSYVLDLLVEYGKKSGFSRDDLSFLEIDVIKQCYVSSEPVLHQMRRSIADGKRRYQLTKRLQLPPLIFSGAEVFYYSLPKNIPNFITHQQVLAECITEVGDANFTGKILFIEAADPGYDWIFSHDIAGFITKFGGANSHMAIRAAELDIAAVIGVGEQLYQKWSQAKLLDIDCINQIVRVVR